jgi:hypothetical protein
MDKSAYIERLETAIMKSSQAMTILREENASLLELNKKLKARNTILESEAERSTSASRPIQPKASTILASRYVKRPLEVEVFLVCCLN